jgi:uncharacterized protein (DUF433 family)
MALAQHHIIRQMSDDPADARVLRTGTPVWAVVGHWRAVGKANAQVAQDYGLTPEEVEAVLAHHRIHREAVDARLRANAA